MGKGKRTKGQKRSTTHFTENKGSSNTNPTKSTMMNSGAPEGETV
jgi:hypothetical protein